MRRNLTVFVLLAITWGTGAWSQAVSNASITGTVTDSSGAVIPEAQIKATEVSTGAEHTTVSTANGSYNLFPLAAGQYRVEVEKAGFEKFVQQGIVLEVGMNPVLNIKLTVGTATQVVEVEASTSQVETQQPGVGQVINQESMAELPLNGRQAIQLITLSGATTPGPSSDMNSNKNYPTTSLSVAGGALTGITFILDGANHNDPFNNLNLPLPMPDALQEFKVETSALPAQYGYHSTAAVNAITKSGTNSFHGVLFDFLRNGVLNARDYFSPIRTQLIRNQWGGTAGGPIKKDKLFFFGAFQGTNQRIATTATVSNLPTTALMSSGFAYTPSGGGALVTVKPSQYSTPSVNLIKQIPVASVIPSTSNPLIGSLTFPVPANYIEYQETGRVDYVRNTKNTMFTRYFLTRYDAPQFYDGTNALLTGQRAGSRDIVNAGTIGDTYIFTQSIVNQFRSSLNRDTTARTVAPFFSPITLGVNMAIYEPSYSNISVSGSLAVGGGTINPGHFNSTTPQVSDDLMWIVGKHQFGFGINYIHEITNTLNTQYPNGQISFGGTSAYTGTPIYDFLLGDINGFSQGDPQIVRGRYNYIGSYAQDLWKVNKKLTISYGIRLDPYLPTYTPNQHDLHFSQADFDNGIESTVYPNAPIGFSYPGDPNYPIYRGSNTNSHWQDIAPRFGIALDPHGDGKTSIRASWGIFYDLPTMFNESRFALASPWGSTFAVPESTTNSFANPYASYPGGNPFPGLFNNAGKGAVFPAGEAMLTMPSNVHPTYIDQYSLSVERQIANNWMAKAEYIGNLTIHQWAFQQIDPSIYIPGTSTGLAGSCTTTIGTKIYSLPVANLPAAGKPCSASTNAQQRTQLELANTAQGALISSVANLDYFGTGSYNGMLLTLQHNMAHNFTLLANYTYSKCISDPVTHELSGDGAAYSNPNNRRFDRGRCPSDIRHLVNISGVAKTSPIGNNPTLRYLTGNWEFTPIVSLRSATFFTVLTGADTAFNGISNIRANLTGSPRATSRVTGTRNIQWLNYSSFSSPVPTASTGNPYYAIAGSNPPAVNAIPGPGYVEFDAAISRTFPIFHEHNSLMFRAEFFNVPNHLNANTPAASLSNGNPSSGGTFGQISSDSNAPGPRIGQLALKFTY